MSLHTTLQLCVPNSGSCLNNGTMIREFVCLLLQHGLHEADRFVPQGDFGDVGGMGQATILGVE
jgi:hypothetical protein